MNLDFIGQIAFFKQKTPTKLRKFAKFKDKTSDEYAAALEIKDILEPLVEKDNRDVNKVTDKLIHKLLDNTTGHFAIVKFDMKNYFPSIALKYAYEYYIKDQINEKYYPLFEKYCDDIKYNLQGLPTSSNFAGVMSKAFKNELLKYFSSYGITDCFYYVDDFVLLFEKYVDEANVKNGILQCINEVFFKQNNLQFQNKVKAHIDDAKYTFISDKSLPTNFTWLGYKFSINKKSQGFAITLDIADSKINYYKKVFFDAVKKNYEDKDKLRLLLYVNTRSIVTKIHKQGKANKNVSLSPFKFYKNFKKYPELIGEDTKKFMQNVVIHAFNEQSLPLPYYLKDNNVNSGYSLWHNFIKNKAIVLNKKFGWSYEKLSKTISHNCDIDIHSKSYEQLAQIFIDNFVIKLQ